MPKRKRSHGDKWRDLLDSDIGTEILSFMPPVPDESGPLYDAERSLMEWDYTAPFRSEAFVRGEFARYPNGEPILTPQPRSYYEAAVSGLPQGYHNAVSDAMEMAFDEADDNWGDPDWGFGTHSAIDDYNELVDGITGFDTWRSKGYPGYYYSRPFDRSRATVNKFKKHYFGF